MKNNLAEEIFCAQHFHSLIMMHFKSIIMNKVENVFYYELIYSFKKANLLIIFFVR